jgi:hypothetical protein
MPVTIRDMNLKIRWLRVRANEVRTLAQEMRHDETRLLLFRTSQSYDNMADLFEKYLSARTQIGSGRLAESDPL